MRQHRSPLRALVVLVAVLAAPAVLPASGAASPALELAVTPVVSPNGDGRLDHARIAVSVSAPAVISVGVLGAGEQIVAVLADGLAAGPGEVQLRWDGRADDGGRAPDGPYRVVAAAVSDAGEAAAEASLRIDTRPPALARLSLTERLGRGPLRLRLRTGDPGSRVRLGLLLRERDGREWTASRRSVVPGRVDVALRPRDRKGARLRPGGYLARVRLTDAAGNVTTSAARPLLVAYPVSAGVYRRFDGVGARVALTFDDCNDGVAWRRILDVLSTRGVRASFFCLGPSISRHAALARRTVRAGHTVGNHTTGHPFLPSVGYADVLRQVRAGGEPWWTVARAAAVPWFRPPYGALDATSRAAIGAAGYGRVVLWDVDPQDWRRPGAATIAARATGPARPGSVILLHVIDQTAQALPSILDRLAAKGLRPVALSELARAAGLR